MNIKEKMKLIAKRVREESTNRRYASSEEPGVPGVRVVLSRNHHDKELWNAVIDLVLSNSYEELNEIQKVLRSVTIYDLEVRNGGHIQYFVNRGAAQLNELLQALTKIEANEQYDILKEVSATTRPELVGNTKELSECASYFYANNQHNYDQRYYQCNPSTDELSLDFVKAHIDQFVKFED